MRYRVGSLMTLRVWMDFSFALRSRRAAALLEDSSSLKNHTAGEALGWSLGEWAFSVLIGGWNLKTPRFAVEGFINPNKFPKQLIAACHHQLHLTGHNIWEYCVDGVKRGLRKIADLRFDHLSQIRAFWKSKILRHEYHDAFHSVCIHCKCFSACQDLKSKIWKY